MVSELEEFAGLVLEFNNLWHAPNAQRKDNEAELLSLLEEMRDHEPAVRVILETVDLELIPICDDFSKVINFVPVTGMQLGGAVHVCKTLEEGRPELAGYLRLLDIYEETSRGGPADPDGRTLAGLCRKEPAVKEILEAIDRAMAGFDISQPEGRQTTREAVTTSLKIVDALDQLDWQMASRMPDGPVMAGDQLHPWGPG